MIKNVGVQDRVIRLTVGLFILILGLNNGLGNVAGILMTLVGIILLATGAFARCPLYKVAGLDTCKNG